MRNKILLVEDNEMIVKGLVYSLSKEGFETNIAYNAQEAESKIESNVYDIIILDVMLPDGNGFELCKHIKENKDIPIIFLTAKDDEKDVVNGFNLGADDYVIKPFRTMELISRIYNVLRRYNKDKNVIEIGQVRIDLEANRVYVDNKEVEFTALEYKILVLLYTNAGKTVTREKILDKIWDVAGNFVNDNTLTVYVKRIRDKLGKSDVIKTIKGIGYRVDKSKEEILIYVTDTGCGIPSDQYKKVFERFYKIDSFVQGAGLGLSVCKTIVEGLGGTINVYSQLKEGSRFSVILPLNRLHK